MAKVCKGLQDNYVRHTGCGEILVATGQCRFTTGVVYEDGEANFYVKEADFSQVDLDVVYCPKCGERFTLFEIDDELGEAT